MKKLLILICIIFLSPLFAAAEQINVAFTIDNNFPMFTMLLMESILDNNDSNSDYKFWVVENNVSDKNKKKMENYIKSRNQQIEFIHFDTEAIDKGTNFFTFSAGAITPIAMARIMLPDLMPKDIHRVLYLDSDMLATGDISEMYNTDLGKYTVGMVKNTSQDETKIYKFKDGYFNSGLILMDLDKCRKENSPKKMVDFLTKHKKLFVYVPGDIANKYFKYPDQDLINIVWDGKIKPLDKKWNNLCIRGSTMDNVLKRGIIHYIGASKPGDFEGANEYLYIEMYFENWRNSPFKGCIKYYFAKRFVNDYRKMVRKKVERYKIFFRKVKDRSNESIADLFYIENYFVK